MGVRMDDGFKTGIRYGRNHEVHEIMSGVGKVLGKVTDTLGLTNGGALEAQQRAYEEQQKAFRNEAAAQADASAQNVVQVDSSGAAQASADAITGDQKRRRASSVSSALGI